MRWQGLCYRGIGPKYASDPTSGDGARINGGRFNAPGTAALYLATDVWTLFAELTQGFAHMNPTTVCSFAVDLDDVLDLRDERRCAALGVDVMDLSCDWLRLKRAGVRAASWDLAERLVATGRVAALLVPSFAPAAPKGGANLVVFRWGTDRPHQVIVNDPTGALPKNDTSWI